jgi:NarL family two-component system response regulator LiaR
MFRNKQFLLYAAALAAIFLLLRWMDYRLLIVDHAFEVYMGLLALLFTLLGIWIALKLARPKIKTVVVEKQVFVTAPEVVNTAAIDKLNLSKRELEVLTLMSRGLSNQEISEVLFVSLNTVKTHTSRLFEKMEVKRRTQAVDLAKKLGIIG